MRTFPEPDQDTLIAYIYHTHRLDRIPMDRSKIEKTLGKTDSDPYVAGHLRAITLVMQLAEDENLLIECPNRFQLDLESTLNPLSGMSMDFPGSG